MAVSESREGGVLVLHLAGRLDGVSSPAIGAELSEAVRANPAVVIDLEALDYVSSAGLRVLIKAAKEAKAAQTKLALAAPGPVVREVFEISGFGTFLAIFPQRAEAVAHVR